MNIRIDVHHYIEPVGADGKLDSILALVKLGNSQGAQIMSKADDINAKLDEIDTQTTEIGNDIDTLLANGLTGLTAEQAQAIQDRLSVHAETLRGIASKA